MGAAPRRRPAAEEGVSPELRVISSARRQRRWQIGALACIGLLVVLFGISAAQTFLVQQQRNIDDLNLRISEAEDRAEDLRLEMARLRSPQRIIDEATNRLGMVPAPVPVYLLPRATDDERAAEQPPPSPTTTVATSSSASEVGPSDSSSPVNEDPTGVVR